jgi:carnitine-CoA ligase
VRGENVSSLELEQAISVHPYVLETAVHAVPSDIEEDDIKACVVVQPGATLEPEPFFDWLRANVPYYAVPRYVDVLEALPKNPVNRVLKTALRETGNTEATWDFRELGLVIGRDQRR